MTLRKYKKMLMSCGVDRNLAEVERRNMARMRSPHNSKRLDDHMKEYNLLASHLVSKYGGSLRKERMYIKECINSIIIV